VPLADICSPGTSEKGYVHGLLRPRYVPISADRNKHYLPELKYLKLPNDRRNTYTTWEGKKSSRAFFPPKDHIQALF